MINHEEYQLITGGGDMLTAHTDPHLLQRHMLSLSPEGTSLIRSAVGGTGRLRENVRFNWSVPGMVKN